VRQDSFWFTGESTTFEECFMKKFLCVALLAATIVTFSPVTQKAHAAPIGLTLRLDGLCFGNVLADSYKFAGKTGQANILPKVLFTRNFGQFNVLALVATNFMFTDPFKAISPVRLQLSYNASINKNNVITVALSERTRVPWGWGFTHAGIPPKVDLTPWIKYTFSNDVFSFYVEFQLGFYWNDTLAKNNFKIGTGLDQNLAPGNQQNVGLVGFSLKKIGLRAYIAPTLVFYDYNTGTRASLDPDFMPSLGVAVGERIKSFDLLVSVLIPTGTSANSKGKPAYDMDAVGVTINPRFTWYIRNNFSVWADAAIGALGSDNDTTLTPTIGMSYSM
jgi:hypothetical protein